jgi:hypothetical protein
MRPNKICTNSNRRSHASILLQPLAMNRSLLIASDALMKSNTRSKPRRPLWRVVRYCIDLRTRQSAEVAAERVGTAGQNVGDGAPMRRRQRRARFATVMSQQVVVSETAEDLRNLCHGRCPSFPRCSLSVNPPAGRRRFQTQFLKRPPGRRRATGSRPNHPATAQTAVDLRRPLSLRKSPRKHRRRPPKPPLRTRTGTAVGPRSRRSCRPAPGMAPVPAAARFRARPSPPGTIAGADQGADTKGLSPRH